MVLIYSVDLGELGEQEEEIGEMATPWQQGPANGLSGRRSQLVVLHAWQKRVRGI